MKISMMIATLALGVTFLLGGCSSDQGDDAQCVSGKACQCTGSSCNQTCGGSGAGCDFNCPAGATCSFSCPAGGCTVHCAGSASCTTDCAGNGCAVDCANTGSCVVKSCTATCTLSCGAAATCDLSCDELSGGCVKTP